VTIATALAEAQQAIGRLEARVLLRHVLRCDEAFLIAHGDDALTAAQSADFGRLIARRAAGEPVAYLTGSREFYGREFAVTPAVLIPRPDTELLIELALQRLPANGGQVLDLGTGSGCIGVTLAAERPQAQVTLVDASANALDVARVNAHRHAAANTALLCSDWFATLGDARYDLIVSNPPYIAAGDAHLQQGDLRFEPQSALAAGADGLDDIRRIVAEAPSHLLSGGWLLCEHGHDQADACTELLQQAGFKEVFSARDLAGIRRVSGGRWNPDSSHDG
jgi:release factor glutamine methyltransferase